MIFRFCDLTENTERNLEMEQKKREIELNFKDLGTVLLRCWWIMLLVGAVVGAGLYLVLRITHTDKYTATASVYVMREARIKTDDTEYIQTQNTDVSISNNLKADVMKLPQTRLVLKQVLDAIDKETTEENFKLFEKIVKTESEEEEHIVYISATWDDPESAYLLANLLMNATCNTLNNTLFTNEQYVKPLDEAIVPQKPSNPISLVLILLVTLGAMLVVYLVFFILFLADDKINDAEDVQNYLHVSLLGQIPNRRDTSRRRKKYGGYYYYTYAADGTKTKKKREKKEDATK